MSPKHLMKEIKKAHQFLVFSVNSICQVTIREYLNVVSVDEIGISYQQKKDYFRKLLETSNFELLPSEGTYFPIVSYTDISS